MNRPTPQNYKGINSDAKKVFEGIIFDVYQWEQKLFDDSTSTFEMLKRPDTVLIFCIDNGKFILNQELQPGGNEVLDFPMGRVDKDGDDVCVAALRELKEETGIVPQEFYYLLSEKPVSKMDWLIHFFISKGIKERTDLKLDAGEKIENKEIDFDTMYTKFKNLELDLPKELLKVLINESKENFFDRFNNPEKYFKRLI